MKKLIKNMTNIPKFKKEETFLLVSSFTLILLSFIFMRGGLFELIASLVGVLSVLLVAKGTPSGQLLMLVFSVLYGLISIRQRYYGEMITYMFMTAPMALLSLISWLRHPYKDTGEVAAERLTVKNTAILAGLTLLVTFIFYFILKALGNASLVLSTVSIATTFAAAGLTFLRSPLYALGYGANDVVLILLWIIASLSDPSSLPMVTCFTAFLANDLYGFINWKKMAARQDV